MTISYTSSIRLWMATPGDPSVANAWAPPLNENMVSIDSAVNGTSTPNVGGLTAYTLAVADGAADEAREQVYNFQGALTAICTVTLPNVQKVGWATNNTTGGFAIVMTAGSGTTATIPADGLWHLFSCDGAGNVFSPTLVASSATLSGSTLTVSGNGTIAGSLTAGSLFSQGQLQVTGVAYMSTVYASNVTCNALSLSGALSVAGPITSGSSGLGSVALAEGSTALTGAVVFYNPNGTQAGYVGSLSNNSLVLAATSVNEWTTIGAHIFIAKASSPTTSQITIDPTATSITVTEAGSTPFTAFSANLNGVTASNFAIWQVSGVSVGSIVPNGAGGTAYNTTSDQRLKIDRGLMSGEVASHILANLKVRWFNWKAEPDVAPEIGFFAQQVQRWCPWAVTPAQGRPGRKNHRPWQIDHSRLVPVLTAALQDALRRIEDLEKAK